MRTPASTEPNQDVKGRMGKIWQHLVVSGGNAGGEYLLKSLQPFQIKLRKCRFVATKLQMLVADVLVPAQLTSGLLTAD